MITLPLLFRFKINDRYWFMGQEFFVLPKGIVPLMCRVGESLGVDSKTAKDKVINHLKELRKRETFIIKVT